MTKQLVLMGTARTKKGEGVLIVHDGMHSNQIVLAPKQGRSLRDAMIKHYPLTVKELADYINKAMQPNDK